MTDIAPQNSIRRTFVVFRDSNGDLFDPAEIAVDVFLDGQASADVTRSAEATTNVSQKATGLYILSYSVAGLSAGTYILEEVRIKPTAPDPFETYELKDAIVQGVVSATLAANVSDSIAIKLKSDGC